MKSIKIINAHRFLRAHSRMHACTKLLTNMKSIGEVMEDTLVSPWRGSPETENNVREQVRARYGDVVADSFSAATDAMPLLSWAAYGFRVRKNEKALKSISYVEVKNDKGEVERKIRRVVNLFHRRQVEKLV